MKSYIKEMLPEDRSYDVAGLPQNIREQVEVLDQGCWRWVGTRAQGGYGRIRLNKKNIAAHRYIFELLACKIPEGAVLRHQCDYPPCVNPAHLIPGTHKQNVDDMVSRGRSLWQVAKKIEQHEAEKWMIEKLPLAKGYRVEGLTPTVREKIDVQNTGCWMWRGPMHEKGVIILDKPTTHASG